jgi:hypothetical protein
MNVRHVVGYSIAGVLGVVLSSYVVAGLHEWLQHIDKSPAITYAPKSVYLKKTLVEPRPEVPPVFSTAGEKAWICFDGISWERLIPQTLTVWFLTEAGKRIDYAESMTVHYIRPPGSVGKLAPKCRAWTIPADLPPGKLTLAGLARPTDPIWEATPVPLPEGIELVVQ